MRTCPSPRQPGAKATPSPRIAPVALALLLASGLAAFPRPARAAEDAEVRQCREWVRSHDPAPAEKTALTRAVSPRTLCFDGQIYPWTLKEAHAWADRAAAAPAARPRLVVRSTGGDAGTAIGLAEKLQRLGTEVTIVDYCMSSCANYFFAALAPRRVAPGALLLFHGGLWAGDRGDVEKSLDETVRDPAMAANLGDPARWRAGELARFDRDLARQDALYRRAGVDPRVVTGMASVDEQAIPASACGPRPGARRAVLFFDVGQLRRLGIAIAAGKPATDPAEVDRSLTRFGFRFTACAVPPSYFGAPSGKGRRPR